MNNNTYVDKGSSREPRPNPLKASYDAGWQKRGTGHAYNSLTGHASLIGYYSGKVLAYATRTKKCAMCDHGHEKSDHDCRLNFDRSAKAMEPDMAVELITKNKVLTEENANISVLIADDDASSIAAVRRAASQRVEKWSDLNHAKKGLTSALYALKLPKGIIDYFSRSFACALKQNKGNAEAVNAALLNVVNHSYGNHENGGTWCRSHVDGSDYIHDGLPGGKPLTDPELRVNLTNLFMKYANNANKLAPCGSSQANESFNAIVSSKHPKTRFYGASESFAFRVGAAVCQKNLGTSYIIPVYEKLGLAAGNETMKSREMKDKQRVVKAKKSATVLCKKRRLFIAKKRSGKNSVTQRREGITYETECGLNEVSELLRSQPPANNDSDLIGTQIVLFDLETSGLSRTAEICQIAAATETQTFNVYMVPTGMTPGAAQTTGLHVEAGELFLHDKRLDTVPTRVGLFEFLAFLRSIGDNIILVAHNGFRFDVPLILRNMAKFGLLTEFAAVVRGFADTLPIFGNHLEDRKKEKKRFSLVALAFDFLGDAANEGAHEAQNDILTLRELIDKIGINNETIQKAAKTTGEILREQERAAIQATDKATLLILKPGVSVGMISKMAEVGISFGILQKAYSDSGENGVKMLLGEDVGGRPRVTKNNKVLKRVVGQLERLAQAN